MAIKTMGLILAGGKSRRMKGLEKSFVKLSGISLLERVVDRLASQVDQIVLNANGDVSRFHSFGLPVVSDENHGYLGPLAGILAGMEYAQRSNCEWIVSVAVDTPFFPKDLVEVLFESIDTSMISLAAINNDTSEVIRQPTFGLWSVSLAQDLRSALSKGVRKIVSWTDQYESKRAVFGQTPINPFFNINTPDDLIYAEKVLKIVQ